MAGAFLESVAESSRVEDPAMDETNKSEAYDDANRPGSEISINTAPLNAITHGVGGVLSAHLVPATLANYVEPQTWGIMDLEHPKFQGTVADHCSFVATAIYWYIHGPELGPYLWACFRNDFEDWEDHNWNQTPSIALKLLASVLRYRGVFISSKRGGNLKENLVELVNLEGFRIWSE